MIDQSSGELLALVVIAFLLLFNLIYLYKKFDLVWLFVNINVSSIVFYLFYQSTLLHYISYDYFILLNSYTLGFVIGYYFHYWVTKRKPKIIHEEEVNYKALYRLNTFGFMIFAFAFLYELSQAAWVAPIFAPNKLIAYYNFPTHFIHYLVVAGIPISGVFAYIAEKYKFRRGMAYFLICIISLALMVQLARAVFMTQLFVVAYFYIRENGIRFNWSKVILVIIILLLLIVILGTLRTGNKANTLLIIGGLKSNWTVSSLPFAWIYLYFTTPIENVREIVVNYNGEFKYGLLTILKPLLNLLNPGNTSNIFHVDIMTKPSAGAFNTYGYFGEVYLDFGYFGFLYTICLGYLSRAIFYSKKLFIYLFSSFWVYCLFTSAVNMYFNQFFTLVYLAYFYLIVKFTYIKIKV